MNKRILLTYSGVGFLFVSVLDALQKGLNNLNGGLMFLGICLLLAGLIQKRK